jgi:hypothetical protein
VSAVVKQALRSANGLRANERLVLVAVAAHMDADGCNAFPSVDTIAALAGVARRTVQRALNRLVELGRLVVDRSRGRRTNVYALPRQHGDAVAPAPTASPGPATVPPRHPTVSPRAAREVEDPREVPGSRADARGWRQWIKPRSTRRPAYPQRRGAALPVPAGQCPRHRGSPAHNCGPCRSERIAVAA